DLKRINWHILWLVGGGIALGNGVADTGLDGWFVDRLDWGSMSSVAFAFALAVAAWGLSTVISNSATANLVAPIGIGIAASGVVDLAPLLVGVIIAMTCSLAMALPISTPPNAVAYASGQVETRDMARVGLIVGAVGIVVVAGVAPPIWQALGLV